MKKSKIGLKLSKKEQDILYRACLYCYPEFTALEYQCNKKQLEVFKKLVIGFWCGRSTVQLVINPKEK